MKIPVPKAAADIIVEHTEKDLILRRIRSSEQRRGHFRSKGEQHNSALRIPHEPFVA